MCIPWTKFCHLILVPEFAFVFPSSCPQLIHLMRRGERGECQGANKGANKQRSNNLT